MVHQLQEEVILEEKWADVLDHEDLAKIEDPYKRQVTAQLLENTEIETDIAGQNGSAIQLTEASPTTIASTSPSSTTVAYSDPVLISMIRRAAPNLIAHDLAGVQPMAGPSGLIFFMKANYGTPGGTEALHNAANREYAGKAEDANGNTRMSTATAEGVDPAEMSMEFGRISVTAESRALKATYSIELAQDMKRTNGMNAEKELAKILSAEIMGEINREVLYLINSTATVGAQGTAAPGTWNMDVDSNGRWQGEKFRGFLYGIEREANAIAQSTRRGRGNVIITSSNIASALSLSGALDHTPALKAGSLTVDDTGNTFAGVLNGRFKVYIDPYAATDYVTVGYKGASAMDAGIFYCPYTPMQLLRATAETEFQPKIAFKTRYGMVANPFATAAGNGVITKTVQDNTYYRKLTVSNLL